MLLLNFFKVKSYCKNNLNIFLLSKKCSSPEVSSPNILSFNNLEFFSSNLFSLLRETGLCQILNTIKVWQKLISKESSIQIERFISANTPYPIPRSFIK